MVRRSFVNVIEAFLLVLVQVDALAIATSPTCTLSSNCSSNRERATDYNPRHTDVGSYHTRVNMIQVKNSHRLNLSGDVAEPPVAAIGIKAELVRYHSTTSSMISTEIKRSQARSRHMKPTAQMSTKFNGDLRKEDQSPGMDTDLTSGAPFEYLMKISIGTPPQRFVAVADTGSDLVWVQCSSPEQNGDAELDPDPHFFRPALSKSFTKLSCDSKPCHSLALLYGNWVQCSSGCEYSYFYADNSSTMGDLSMETLHMKTTSLQPEEMMVPIDNFAFGCGIREFSSSFLYTKADGIVGLGKGPLSFPHQLGAMFGRKFSYCLVDRKNSTIKSSPILFGDVAVPTIPGVQYTPFIDNPQYPTYYYVGLEGIDVGRVELDIPRSTFAVNLDTGDGGTIIDSGTTYTQLVAPAYDALLEALIANITYDRVVGYFDLCYDVTGVADNSGEGKPDRIVVPSISFQFHGGAQLNLPFQNAFVLVVDHPEEGKTTMCLAINSSTDLGFTIIGNYQQSDFHILYDLQEQRLGFVPQQCSASPD